MVPTAPRTLTSLPNTSTDSQIRNALFTVLNTLKQKKYLNLEKTVNNNICGITSAFHSDHAYHDHHYPDLGSISDCGCNKFLTYQKQPYISMKFLGSLLWHHFTMNPLVALQNLSCFLRGYIKLQILYLYLYLFICHTITTITKKCQKKCRRKWRGDLKETI